MVFEKTDRVALNGTPGMYEKTFARAIPISLGRRCGGGQPKATGRHRRRLAIRRIAIALYTAIQRQQHIRSNAVLQRVWTLQHRARSPQPAPPAHPRPAGTTVGGRHTLSASTAAEVGRPDCARRAPCRTSAAVVDTREG